MAVSAIAWPSAGRSTPSPLPRPKSATGRAWSACRDQARGTGRQRFDSQASAAGNTALRLKKADQASRGRPPLTVNRPSQFHGSRIAAPNGNSTPIAWLEATPAAPPGLAKWSCWRPMNPRTNRPALGGDGLEH